MGHMVGSIGGFIWMLLGWLIGLGLLFAVVYGAVYLGVRRALQERDRELAGQDEAPAGESEDVPQNGSNL